ncbi:MAG: hypothetical protein P8X74_04705 [Reinekea sp.]|jgi:hypothetical protein
MDLISFQITFLDVACAGCVILLSVLLILNRRKLELLENRLEQIKLTSTREIKMLNQGTIGMGRRFEALEKQCQVNRKADNSLPSKNTVADNVSSFEAVMKNVKKPSRAAKPVAKAQPQRHSQPSSQAEKALSEWVRANQTA